jgi:hypothetical protein
LSVPKKTDVFTYCNFGLVKVNSKKVKIEKEGKNKAQRNGE